MINLQEQLTSTNVFIPVNTDKIHWSLIVGQVIMDIMVFVINKLPGGVFSRTQSCLL